ncbi:Uncharacterized protein OBRU01_19392 [Operophtera brumata]|uniref:Uncharacterized protein n=1 Tax=Operophtera brumata TaxID=104452 RepID=A0A0L7KXD3_OPEBR|nr:Uncharacterized protein OBRU01_19392 [Operophtera brumata]
MKTPGPGAHSPERCPLMREPRAPIYSKGARLGFDLKRAGPASNAYALREYLFNMKTPGPGAHAPERCPLMPEAMSTRWARASASSSSGRARPPTHTLYVSTCSTQDNLWLVPARACARLHEGR